MEKQSVANEFLPVPFWRTEVSITRAMAAGRGAALLCVRPAAGGEERESCRSVTVLHSGCAVPASLCLQVYSGVLRGI